MKLKLDVRGGERFKIKLKTSQARLLHALWELHGGPTMAAKKLGVHQQMPINWRVRGFVPLKKCADVSRILDVPQLALNYTALKPFGFKPVSSWTTIVTSIGFDKKTEEWILKGKHPL